MSGHYRSIFAPGLFTGKVVVVTGGGSGIGRCTAHELAALGAHVVLIGRKLEKLHETAGEIVADGGLASFHACDIRDEGTVKTTVQAMVAVHGRVDALVNNAGGQFIAPLETISVPSADLICPENFPSMRSMDLKCTSPENLRTSPTNPREPSFNLLTRWSRSYAAAAAPVLIAVPPFHSLRLRFRPSG